MKHILHKSKSPTAPPRIWAIAVVTGALLFGIISLVIGIGQSVWFDEAYSITLAHQSVAGLLHLTSLDTHPPLYYLLLKVWAGVFGFNEVPLRTLSVVFGMGAIVMAALVSARLFGKRVAIGMLPFVVLSPLFIRYGFEIRMYSLAAFVGLLASYLMIRALANEPGRRRTILWIGYGVSVAIGTYSLYYLVLLWVAHLVWLVYSTRKSRRSLVRAPWVRAFLLSVLLFLPYLPSFISQIHSGAAAAISQPITYENAGSIISFMFLYKPVWQLSPVLSLLLILLIGVLIRFAVRGFREASDSERSGLSLLLTLFLIPIAILALVGLEVPAFTERYISHVALYGYLFVAALAVINFRSLRLWPSLLSIGILLVLAAGVVNVSLEGNYNFQRLQKPTVNVAAAALQPCERPIIASDPYTYIELSYYLPNCELYFYSPYSTLSGGYAPVSGSLYQIKSASDLTRLDRPEIVYYDGALATELEPYAQSLARIDQYGSLRVAR